MQGEVSKEGGQDVGCPGRQGDTYLNGDVYLW